MNFELLQILLNIILITTVLYIICIIAFTVGLYNLKERFFTFNKKINVKVSVLIAARNEGKNIYKLLQSLYYQTFLSSRSPTRYFVHNVHRLPFVIVHSNVQE